MHTAMHEYWQTEGVTDQQRQALLEEGLDDPAQQDDISVDNTVATETTESGEVLNTTTVDSAAEDPEITLIDDSGSGSGSGNSSGSGSTGTSTDTAGESMSSESMFSVVPVSAGGASSGFLSGMDTTTLAIGGAVVLLALLYGLGVV